MKIIILTLLVFPIFMAGCATAPTGDIRNLKRRMSAIEERQNIVESDLRERADAVTVVAEPRVKEVFFTGDAASMNSKDIQTALKRAGYYHGAIDGKIGPMTRRAIIEFQTDNKLKVDGIAGPQTKNALLRYLRR